MFKQIKKLLVVGVFSLVSTVSYAGSSSCDGFEVVLSNHLPSNLLLTERHVEGASLDPMLMINIPANGSQRLIVKPDDHGLLKSAKIEFKFNTLSLPTRQIKVKFKLENFPLICLHSDLSSHGEEGVVVDSSRGIGKITYKISN